MTPEQFSRPSSEAPFADVVHRRWLLSKRPDDGRPLLVREDRVVRPSGFGPRPGRSAAAEAERAGGAPGFVLDPR
jgi:hypothetical protein